MKKALMVIIMLFVFILPVKADLTDSQASDLAFFAENFILEGNKRIGNDGFPIFAYSQGQPRIDGFQSKLSWINKSYNGKFGVRAYKWSFDCSSFASYVYYQTFGLVLTRTLTSQVDSYSGLRICDKTRNPYCVSDFVLNADSNKHFYYIMKNVPASSVDLSKLKKGDLIVIVGSHIMVYVGDGKIAHASASAITSSNLGLEVVNLAQKYGGTKVSVIRLKDKIIPPDKKANMTITWLDNKSSFDFRTLQYANDIPVVSYTKSTDKWAQKLTLDISFTDKDGLSAYAFNDDNFIAISGNENKVSKEITENGTYVLKVKDILNNIKTETIEINNIDTIAPLITSFAANNKTNYSVLTVVAKDEESGLAEYPYSFDNKATWTNKTTYEVSTEGEHYVYVKDNAGNESSLKVNVVLSKVEPPSIGNIINGEVTDNKRKIIISLLNNNESTKIIITNNGSEPANDQQWQPVVGNVYTVFLEEGTYYVWLKDNYSNVIGPQVINVKLNNSESKFELSIFIYIIPIILIGTGIYLFMRYRNNKI